MAAAGGKGTLFQQLSAAFHKNTLFKHDKKDRPSILSSKLKLEREKNSHTRPPSDADLTAHDQADRNLPRAPSVGANTVAPSATVTDAQRSKKGGLASITAEERVEAGGAAVFWHKEGNKVDVDVQLGYPAQDIIHYWRQRETTRRVPFSPDCEYINHRRYMVDWLSEIGEELHLQATSIHVAIAYMDEVMIMQGYQPGKWRMQVACCISVAAKYEEAECNMPMVTELADATQLRMTTSMITKGELALSRSFHWEISRVTSMHYLTYYLHQGVAFPEDQCQGRPLVEKVVRYIQKYVEFFANLCQQDYQFQAYTCAMVASASIAAARRALCVNPPWREELVELTGHTEEDITPCLNALWTFYEIMFPTHKPLRTESPKCVSEVEIAG